MDNLNTIPQKKKTSIFWKYIKRILLSILIFFVLLIGTAFVIVFFYQDSIKKLIIDQINKQLTTEIQVKKVELSLFEKFPSVSLSLIDVTAKDAIKFPTKDNLLKAENIYLQFDIWDLYYKNYRINKIEVKNAFIKLIVYQNGADNYHFWKPDTTTNAKNSLSFDLQKIIFDNVYIRYVDFPANQDYSGIAKNMVLKGKFGDDKYTLHTYGNLFVNYINVSGVNYFPGKSFEVNMALDVDQKTGTYLFTKGDLFVGNLKFDVTGEIIHNDKKKNVDLSVKGADIKLQSLLSEIPYKYRKYLEDYKEKGELYFTAKIIGSYLGKDEPEFKINFGISNGQIIHKKTDIWLEDVNFTGEFTNGNQRTISSSILKINNFSFKIKSGIIKGNFTVKNFKQPEITVVLDAKADIKDLQDFLKLDTINSIDGKIEMNVSFSGKMDNSEEFTINNFLNSKTSGKLKISETDFVLKNDHKKFTGINGLFQFSNNDLIVEKLSGNVLSSDFTLKGYFKNLLPYLFLKAEKLLIDADFSSVNIDLGELLQNTTTSKDTTYKLTFSDKIDCKLSVNIGKLKFEKFAASRIVGNIKLKNKQLLASPLSFNGMDGKTEGMVLIDGTQKNKLLISCDVNITDVNIKKVFYEFENFGQNNLKDENLKGTLKAGVQFAGVWSSDFKVDMDKIYVKTDIKIDNGELINYAPMKGLSKFLKVNDLNDVKFATLHNNIEIKNKIINMPAMEIRSSAIDIIASGTHTFDNKIDYRIQLKLSDLLAKKAKKAKPENEEFGVVADDGLGKTNLFVRVYGTVNNPEYKYDAKGVKQKIVLNFVKEKQNLKTILNEEFGFFKKDSSVINNKAKQQKVNPSIPSRGTKEKLKNKEKENLKKQENGGFIIEWD
ncbi:MAG: hypothetical protein HGB12_00720 [Bacteroidetes bacterium]|nr:hypothetical protein [Bacteroidota bacterium]